MELWNALQAVSPDYGPAACAAGIAVVFAIVSTLILASPGSMSTLRAMFVTALGAVAVVSLFVAAHHFHSTTNGASIAVDGLIADYLLDEYNLIVLDPIEYRNSEDLCLLECPDPDEPQAQTSAVTPDGSVVHVDIDWLDFSAAPLNPDAKLPSGFNPVTVTITPPPE